MKRATEALVKSAQQVREREDEANVEVNKKMVGGVAQVSIVMHSFTCWSPGFYITTSNTHHILT